MKKQIRFLMVSFCLLLCSAGGATVTAADKPKATLRQVGAEYYIDILTGALLQPHSTVAASIYRPDAGQRRKVASSANVPDCVGDQPPAGQFCKVAAAGRLRIRYRFAAPPVPDADYFVAFDMVALDPEDTTKSFPLGLFLNTGRDFAVSPPIVNSIDEFDDKKILAIVVAVPEDATNLDEAAIEKQIEALYKWVADQQANPAGSADVVLEPLTQKNTIPYPITGIAISPPDVATGKRNQGFTIFLNSDTPLPTEKFNVTVNFKNNPPLELTGTLFNKLAGVSHITVGSASDAASDTSLGARALDSNLDLGFALSSSVKDETTDEGTVRERQTNATLDLLFAPVLNKALDPPGSRDPDQRNNLRRFITPIFIDAKVSNGKINADTLALNRIIIGSEFVFRFLERRKSGTRNKYIFTIRGSNASDRDFKRVEAKGAFEFRPILDKLTDPLEFSNELHDVMLDPDGGKKVVPVGNFGYQFEPFVGVEVGRTYRERRDVFEGEEVSRNVRRLYFGTNIVFNLTRYADLKLTDIFYLRGEAPDDRARNYFNGSLEAPLGNIGQRTAHSVFFSFERGDQPPFASPSVNVLKLGYRIKSDFSRIFR